MKVIFLGLPGAGKTTLGRILASYIGVTHISVGELSRLMMREKTPLGLRILADQEAHGGWAPLSDEFAAEIALSAINGLSGWVLDGFPRTVEQARELGEIDLVVYLNVSEDVCIRRMQQRNRQDDQAETPQQRVAIDRERLPALLEYCRQTWPVIEIDSSLTEDESWQVLEGYVVQM